MNVDANIVGIITAITALVAGIFGFFVKIWRDQLNLMKQIMDVVERNSTSNEQLRGVVTALKESTERNTVVSNESIAVTRQTRDALSQLTLEIIKKT